MPWEDFAVMAEKIGRGRPPKPVRLRRTRRLPLMLTTAEHATLKRYCTRHNVTASEVVRGCVSRFLESVKSDVTSGVSEEKGSK
jgi:hypothetical protein